MNIVITGASKGIGLELCRIALINGHQICAIARTATESAGLKQLSVDFKDKIQFLNLDVSLPEAPQKIFQAVKDWSAVDMLINNAGILESGDDEAALMKSFRVNAVAPYLITKEILPLLKKASQSIVVQVSSKMGSIADNTSGGNAAYRASKTALNMYNKCIAEENKWLTAIVVHPGWVKTNMGGQSAPVQPADSAAGLWQVITNAKKFCSTANFFDYQGQSIPW